MVTGWSLPSHLSRRRLGAGASPKSQMARARYRPPITPKRSTGAAGQNSKSVSVFIDDIGVIWHLMHCVLTGIRVGGAKPCN